MHIHAILTHNNACNNCKSDNIPYIILEKKKKTFSMCTFTFVTWGIFIDDDTFVFMCK